MNESFLENDSLWRNMAVLVMFAFTVAQPTACGAEAANNVALWDTASPFADTFDPSNRTGWKAVPTNLLSLEADPAKAASDPGYYGREYSFKGDAVVENHSLAAVFWSAKGRMVIYAKAAEASTGPAASATSTLGRKLLEFAPLQSKSQPVNISRCEILRHAGDEVALEAFFAAKGSEALSARFTFGRTEIIEIKPGEKLKGIRLIGPIEYGVVPAFVGDDLIVNAAQHPSSKTLCLPSENCFVGLLPGEANMFVMTWPKGKQQIGLGLGGEPQGKRLIESIDFEPDGQSFFFAPLGAPGIWHREELKPTYLEKDVAIQWKRPFPARWQTQLSEAGVKTTFAFRESKGQVWRGVPGSYVYPVWFNGDTAFYHLSKKVPPKGESLVYFLEGQGTPLSVSTPVDILKATLGRPMSESILDIAGRKLRTHHPRSGVGVHRACTCGYTEAIQAVFEAGQETAKKDYVAGALDDMIFFVRRHLERIDEYRQFAGDMTKFLQSQGSSATELKPLLEGLEQIVRQIPQECEVQKENMKSLEHAGELARQTIALTSRKSPNNLKAYMELLKAWRAMGGAQDYVVAQCHAVTRKFFQEAGYAALNQAKAVEVAEEIRRRCRQCLRNPDGYEIWADY
ncbi:MAG: hypothetical protein HY735_35325 [Verrucomicrobia bacterium]|nr:hypothetical protein [Verrucomicrobiota bacterium]